MNGCAIANAPPKADSMSVKGAISVKCSFTPEGQKVGRTDCKVGMMFRSAIVGHEVGRKNRISVTFRPGRA